MSGRIMDMDHVNYDGLPEMLQHGAQMWINHGVAPGDFLSAVIRNDLKGACFYADDVNRHRLFEIVRWWYNEPPSACWGSVEKFEAWKAAHAKAHAESGYASPTRYAVLDPKRIANDPEV